MRQPVDFLPGEKADREHRLGGLRGAACRFDGGLGLVEGEPGVIEKGAAGVGQRGSLRAAVQQPNADLMLEVADLAAERGLRGVQPLLGGEREAAGLGDRNEIAQMA